MKKALVVLMALAMVFSAFADAPAAKCEVTDFSGNASVTWTVDFDDATKTGFSNASSASLTFTLATQGTKSASGDGAVYGEIAIKAADNDLKISGGSITAPSLSVSTAKLHVGPAAINILGTDVKAAGVTTADNGITVEYGVDKVADFKLAFGSDVATITTKDITSDNYGFGVVADIKAVDGLTAKAAFNMKLYGANPWNVDATVGYAIAGADVSVNITKKSVEDFVTIAPSVSYVWGSSTVECTDRFGAIYSGDLKAGIYISTTIKTADKPAIPLTVKIVDDSVANLAIVSYVAFTNLSDFDANVTKAGIDLRYSIADAATSVYANVDTSFADAGNTLKLSAGASYTGIANTTVSVGYTSGNLLGAKAEIGSLATTVKIAL